MASVVFSAAGQAAGQAIPVVGGAIGGAVGSAIGGAIGSAIDSRIFAPPDITREGARYSDLNVQVSTYGKMIPLIFGHSRIAGNVIWSRPIKETATTTTQRTGGGKGGGRTKVNNTTYSYSITLAIALCEGEIDEVLRVWADAKQIDLSGGAYRIYNGSEEQLPDPVIESFEGIGKTPAYHGIAYVVIEDFPLADFGNRIPNFTFEVRKSAKPKDYQGKSTEEMVKSMVMIPGAGEFVYDTLNQEHLAGEEVDGSWALANYREPVNRHHPWGGSNAKYSLDQLQKICPNLEWVSVVVSWFADSLDAGSCSIYPAVEFIEGGTTEPAKWSVAGRTRKTARRISYDENNRPRYGGTPDDASLLRYIAEIKSRGLKVMLLPMIFMDIDGKPWRGRVSGSQSGIANFFNRSDGYRNFIMHYANLLGDELDAFAIGSELVGITTASEKDGVYGGVNQLVSLAASVKNAVGTETKVTYAADWSEYHHAPGGWYHLDPLWSSDDIDMVGIDAYFPLSDEAQSELGYDIEKLRSGWSSGEGYDWYYADEERGNQMLLQPQYAWKNISWWWENEHINPDGGKTAWNPESKKIWFTEFGFPSVDGASNQPNVFYAKDSIEGGLPRHSEGDVDVRAQRAAITATLAEWEDSGMIENMFLWTWDARPYPFYPDLKDVWSDYSAWPKGHWVNGKFGLSALAEIVKYLSLKSGVKEDAIDVSMLDDLVKGYVITQTKTARYLIEDLMNAYFFDAVTIDNKLKFIPRGEKAVVDIMKTDLVAELGEYGSKSSLVITRTPESELPKVVEVVFLSKEHAYQQRVHEAVRYSANSNVRETVNLPLVLSDAQAKRIADIILYERWLSRLHYSFSLSHEYSYLEPSDIIRIIDGDNVHNVRITNILQDRGIMQIEAVAEDRELYQSQIYEEDSGDSEVVELPAITRLELLDLPALPGNDANRAYLHAAMAGEHARWQGAALYESYDNEENYSRLTTATESAAIGAAINQLPAIASTVENRIDRTSYLEVIFIGDAELENIADITIANNKNALLVGDEIIQFEKAELIGEGKWKLSNLLRGRLGTEWAAMSHKAGERVVILDDRIAASIKDSTQFGADAHYKGVTLGTSIGEALSQSFSYQARSLKPYAPVHIKVEYLADGNLQIGWTRRTRANGNWRSGSDVPLMEEKEEYIIELIDNVGNIRHTATTNQSNYLYNRTQQEQDFGEEEISKIRIYQNSAIVGKGYVGELQVISD